MTSIGQAWRDESRENKIIMLKERDVVFFCRVFNREFTLTRTFFAVNKILKFCITWLLVHDIERTWSNICSQTSNEEINQFMAKTTIEDINLYIYSRLFAIVGQQINCFTSCTWGAFQKSELAGRTVAGQSFWKSNKLFPRVFAEKIISFVHTI